MTQPHTLYVFGTGNATMTRYYNTCFAIRSGEEYFMTDAGGGNGILRILEEMQVALPSKREIMREFFIFTATTA